MADLFAKLSFTAADFQDFLSLPEVFINVFYHDGKDGQLKGYSISYTDKNGNEVKPPCPQPCPHVIVP